MRLARPLVRAALGMLLCPAAASAVSPGSTALVSGQPGSTAAFPDLSMSAEAGERGAVSDDGRFVLFAARSRTLVADAPARGVYLKDLVTGAVTLVSRSSRVGPGIADDQLAAVAIDDDATHAAFLTAASLSPKDTNASSDLYVRDLSTGVTTLASAGPTGDAIGGQVRGDTAFSGDGSTVAFTTAAGIAPLDTNGASDVYVRDLATGVVSLASRRPDGSPLHAGAPSISDDGRRVAFVSFGSGTADDTNSALDAYVYDLTANTLELGSRQNGAGGQASPTAVIGEVALSGDGGTVAFTESGGGFADGGSGGDVHRHLLGTTVTQLVSRANGSGGARFDGGGGGPLSIDDSGAVIAFTAAPTNADGDQLAGGWVRRAAGGETERVTVRADGSAIAETTDPILSGDGQHVAFTVDGARAPQTPATPDLDGSSASVVLRDLSTTPRRTLAVSRPSGSDPQVPGLRRVLGRPDVSADGRYVAFIADAPGYLPAGTDVALGVYRRDLVTGAITEVSFDSDGTRLQARRVSPPSISDDGRRIAFATGGGSGTGQVSDGAIGHVLVRDVDAGTTVDVDAPTGGSTTTNNGGSPVISGDGTRVAFVSRAQLDPADPSTTSSVYLRDLATRTTTLISRADGAGGGGNVLAAFEPAIDADGSRVAFSSDWNGYGTGTPAGTLQVLVRDVPAGRTLLASTTSSGQAGTAASERPYLDATGELIGFTTRAPLVPGDADTEFDPVLKDLRTGTVSALHVPAPGQTLVTGASLLDLSADGNLALVLAKTSMDPATPTTGWNLFVRDRRTGTSRLASRRDGLSGTPTDERVHEAAIGGDGCVAFLSAAPDLGLGNGAARAYLRATAGECPAPARAGTGSGESAAGAGPTARPAQRISRLRVTPARPRAGKRFSLQLDLALAGQLTTRVERLTPGKRRGSQCVAPARAPRGKRCDRTKLVGTVTATPARGGAAEVRIPTRLGRARLTPGRYRFTVTATAEGAEAATGALTVTIRRAAR